MSQIRTPEAYRSLLKWSARREKLPFLEYAGRGSGWVIVSLPYATHYDRGERPFEVGCDLCLQVENSIGDGYFRVRAGIFARHNITSYIYSPHTSWSPFRAPWGRIYHGTFCGSSNIWRAESITGMVKLGILQQSRSEGHYTVSASVPRACGVCGKFFRTRYGSESTLVDGKSVFLCPECAYSGDYDFHYCASADGFARGKADECRCSRPISEDMTARYLNSETVRVKVSGLKRRRK